MWTNWDGTLCDLSEPCMEGFNPLTFTSTIRCSAFPSSEKQAHHIHHKILYLQLYFSIIFQACHYPVTKVIDLATLRGHDFADPGSHRYPSLAEVIFQGAGGTLDSSEDESCEEEDVVSMLTWGSLLAVVAPWIGCPQ